MSTQNNPEIDVELFAKEGKEVPKGHVYIITIDRQKFKVQEECMTGRQILVLAGKRPPERFQLNLRLKGGKVVKVGYDEKVCFTTPGVEKFMTIPLDQTEGGR
ncbi:MAG TPA: multiubiquitin domain-containing protein [Chitinophagaceae bacterium]|jgi:hypothetical protein|nr:multiubiquitin domain-containing protein [Chitinophagaceae bacterium]